MSGRTAVIALALVGRKATSARPRSRRPAVLAQWLLGLGDQHSCALSATTAYCWGANDSGQFGSGQTGDSAVPVEVVARAGATQIGGGNLHTCSLASGAVTCSGTNADGALGDGTTTQRFTPVTAIAAAATGLGVGYQNTCAIVAGSVLCWGDNTTRQVDATSDHARSRTRDCDRCHPTCRCGLRRCAAGSDRFCDGATVSQARRTPRLRDAVRLTPIRACIGSLDRRGDLVDRDRFVVAPAIAAG